jgi:hypothetical protein
VRFDAGVQWASASQCVSVKELRAAIGLSRERLEDAYAYLLEQPPLGLAVQRHADELSLVTATEVRTRSSGILAVSGQCRSRARPSRCWPSLPIGSPSHAPALSSFVAPPVTRALDTLLQRQLIEHNQHHLLVTTPEFLDLAGLRHLADLPPLPPTL